MSFVLVQRENDGRLPSGAGRNHQGVLQGQPRGYWCERCVFPSQKNPGIMCCFLIGDFLRDPFIKQMIIYTSFFSRIPEWTFFRIHPFSCQISRVCFVLNVVQKVLEQVFFVWHCKSWSSWTCWSPFFSYSWPFSSIWWFQAKRKDGRSGKSRKSKECRVLSSSAKA